MNFKNYNTEGFFDELFFADGTPRVSAEPLVSRIQELPEGELARRQIAAESAFFANGITFAVYGNKAGKDKIIPFDVIPRIVSAADWKLLDKGLRQRTEALNCFLNDIYGEKKILRDKIVPESLIRTCPAYREQMENFPIPRKIWAHITGTDLVRDTDGTFYVLEDNMRCPSGVSYVLQNRQILKRTFPQVFSRCSIRPVDEYCARLRSALEFLTENVESPKVVVLSPGVYNSAYYEHAFLAQQMGVDLVCGNDLLVKDLKVYARTTNGLVQVHVIYRRIDDDFLDPLAFRADSVLGVPGLMNAYKAGNVALANAPGCGVADDKAIYTFVPEIIRYYLGEEAIIPNVPTFVCENATQRKHVLENIEKMVVKATSESGGYGMLVGPKASKAECESFKEKILANPRNYIAQPMISLSRVPCIVDGGFEGRHVDLRPYIIQGKETYILPGGLTRVALKKGSIVVNSSQGGGCKDTWVLAENEHAPEHGQARQWMEQQQQ
ncbi:circularly permuted type 2 ATP-grasp protein [uncultured Fibrobacter sp.]|uniref:circularly permuted type 2 ATP-grasp protein n=1 Tax=uncultured Fibrobacter sp. TaxID=261512 RepID=UPI00280489E7|nr:circularly permuted type 2 ATP-grasp protein [uncultured Fibrobacter sp.]